MDVRTYLAVLLFASQMPRGSSVCHVPVRDDGRPQGDEGECFFTEFHGARLILESDIPFSAHGSIFLSNTRLVFALRPPPAPRKPGPALALPLAWINPQKFAVRKPFFDAPHITGTLVPGSGGLVSPIQPARYSSEELLCMAPPGKLVSFRIELLDENDHDELFSQVKRLTADPERAREQRRLLRDEADKHLVETGVHTAFYDPLCPSILLLTTHMDLPKRP